MPGICLSASICLRFAVDNLESGIPHSLLFVAGKKILELLEIAMERLLEEEDLLGEEMEKLKKSDMMHSVIADYLFA